MTLLQAENLQYCQFGDYNVLINCSDILGVNRQNKAERSDRISKSSYMYLGIFYGPRMINGHWAITIFLFYKTPSTGG